MNKTYKGTLTRWHKIADRLGKEYASLTNTAKTALTDTYVQQYLGPDQEVRLRKAANDSLDKLERAMLIQDVIVYIRQNLSAANEAHGVSRELAEYDKLNRRSTLLNNILQAQGTEKATVSELANIVRTPDQGNYLMPSQPKVHVCLLDQDGLDRLTAKAQEASVGAYAKADRIADLNKKTLELEIPEEVASIAGL